ncbi:AsmA family protein [Myroides injenensis]|uniref:AsmA family protein n=1 Tax=Myroides injenensis TaxID=1183151 RepID=UPI000289EBB5|nr:AsmA-like C-terminal region-containing protein [Myroides injenensis]
MSSRLKSILIKVCIILGSIVGLLLLAMYLIPIFYGETINDKVEEIISEKVEGNVEFDKIEVSFYKKFPLLTATIVHPMIEGIQVDSLFNEKLFEAESVSIGINLLGLLKGSLSFDRIYIDNPYVNINVNEDGLANYNLFLTKEKEEADDSSFDLKINRIQIKGANVIYNDLASKLSFVADNFDYVGRGNMAEAVFDLKSVIRIQSLDLNFDGVHYVKEKPILAKLETSIDTKSLTFIFEKNDIRIKNLPVDFKGKFAFIENGYDMLFDIKTVDSSLEQLLSIVPPEYQDWLESTIVQGTVDGNFKLEGKYVVSDTLSPNVDLSLKVKDGFIQHGELVKPIENLNLDFNFSLPSLDIQKNILDIQKLSFSVDSEETKATLYSKGLDSLLLKGNIDSKLNLELFNRAIGIDGFSMSGNFEARGEIEGLYTKDIRTIHTLRKTIKDTVISSIPRFDLKVSVSDGMFKLKELPEAIKNINFNVEAKSETSNYKDIEFKLKDLNLVAMNNYINGYLNVYNLKNYSSDGSLKAKVDLENLKQFLPIEDIELKGLVDFKGFVKGTYEPKRKKYPVIDAEIQVSDGYIRLERIPDLPLEDIHIHTLIKSSRGSLSDLTIKVLPIDFSLGGESFHLDASLYNLNNLNYNVKSKGTLNIGNLYKLFKVDGIDVKGKLITNLFLSGLQSDALNGKYDKLKNGGMFEVDNIAVTSELFPKPLLIKKGVFKFFKEKMKFEKFEATYGSSKFHMNGYLTNVINYILKDEVIEGEFALQSPYMNIDEFMVFSSGNTSTTASKNSGVIQVPSNWKLNFLAEADNIKYTDYTLSKFKGGLLIDSGKIKLNSTTFDLIGTNVRMDGYYAPKGFKKAEFDYHLAASDFDIQRAYKEVPIFKEMVSMAKDAYGKVSVDYSLKGDLNSGMFPIYKSIVGGGSLTLEDIKFKGFKLLGGIAEKTDAKSLENGSLSKVNINSTIKDNVITIERTKMKMAGFRPRFEGQVSLDGELNIGFRLGLPPLGIIGIPMRITGNSEDFNIKLGRYKASDVLGQNGQDDDEDDDEKYEIKSVNDPLPEIETETNENSAENVEAKIESEK